MRGPLGAHVVRCAEGGRVVDDRAATEAAAGDELHLALGGGLGSQGVEIEEPGLLAAVEVALVVEATGLEDDDVEPGRGEHPGRRTAAGTAADHHHVAGQVRVTGDGQRGDRRGRRVGADAERAGIAHPVPQGRAAGHVVGEQGGALEALEECALRADAGVRQRQQDRLALRLAELREPSRPPGQCEPEGTGVPRVEERLELAHLAGARVGLRDPEGQLVRSDLGRGRDPVAAGGERVGDETHRPDLPRGERHGPTVGPVMETREDFADSLVVLKGTDPSALS